MAASAGDEPTRPPSEGGARPGGEGGGFAAGSEFAGHRIEAEIGRGGMGVVYRARHLALDRERALKVVAPSLSADGRFRERFRRESRLAASIEHPNVIPVHHAGEEQGRLFIAMRLVDGSDLQREVAANGPLRPDHAAAVIAQAAAALDAAHAAGLVHRDVKPANVLLERAGRVFLTDFGISRTATGGDTVTSTGEILGSPDYVAPEQVEGRDVDALADVYSLGAVLHFALTGQPPFERPGDMAKLYAHVNSPRPRPSQAAPWLPPAIDDVVARSMAVDPAERYATAGGLAEAATAALAGAGRPPPTPPPTQRPKAEEARTRGQRHRRRLTGAALAGSLVAAGVAAALLVGGGDGDGAAPGPEGPQPRAVDAIRVGGSPTGLTVGDGYVWVGSAAAGAIYRIDPARGRANRVAIPLGGTPRSLAVGFGSVWAAIGERGDVLRLDPARELAPVRIPVRGSAGDVAVDDDWVWVANETADAVTRIDPVTNQVSRVVPVGAGPRGIATGEGAVWVTNIDDGTLSKIDPADAKTIGRPIPVGQRPSDVAVGGGSVWAMDNFGGIVVAVDPRSLHPGEPITVGEKPRGVKFGFGQLWVASGGEDSVSRIDPATEGLVGPAIAVGDEPADIAVGHGAVWTSNSDGGTVTRIDPG